MTDSIKDFKDQDLQGLLCCLGEPKGILFIQSHQFDNETCMSITPGELVVRHFSEKMHGDQSMPSNAQTTLGQSTTIFALGKSYFLIYAYEDSSLE